MWLGPRRVDGVALVARLPSTDTAALVLLSGPLPPQLVLRRILVAWLREPGARPAQTGLDFVKQQQDVALVAQAAQAGEPALRRNDNACLSLYWPRPNSRVTSRQMAQSIGSRAAMSSSKRPYGFTCSQISGVRARRSLGVSFPDHCDCASTCCNMRVLM